MSDVAKPAAPSTEALAAALDRVMPGVRADLERLVRIPSVSAAAFDQTQVSASAELVAVLLREAGLAVRVVAEGGRPAVIGQRPGPPGAPTVLLYAHHDVQPPGPERDWVSPAFQPSERDGRLYGRGVADDKAGVMAHVAALRAWAESGVELPVGVAVFVEGEEEIGSPTLSALLAAHRQALSADVLVLADSGNWQVGVPALTTSLRGLVEAYVEVRTLDHAVHSGMFGGAVPDALTVLLRLLASLHDADGNVAVAGLHTGPAADLDYDEARLRAESGLLDGVATIGTGAVLERMWTRPAVTVVGIDVPTCAQASNTLLPATRAKVSLRVAPGQRAEDAYEALRGHLLARVPWGARVEIIPGEVGQPFLASVQGPAVQAARDAFAEAFGHPVVDMGAGGSIPFVAEFVDAFPQAAVLVTGVEDPDSRAHGANESLHLRDFARVCLAETLLLRNLAG